MIIRMGKRYLGLVELPHTPCAAAVATLAPVRELGITHILMSSGDNQRVVDAVVREVGTGHQ